MLETSEFVWVSIHFELPLIFSQGVVSACRVSSRETIFVRACACFTRSIIPEEKNPGLFLALRPVHRIVFIIKCYVHNRRYYRYELVIFSFDIILPTNIRPVTILKTSVKSLGHWSVCFFHAL